MRPSNFCWLLVVIFTNGTWRAYQLGIDSIFGASITLAVVSITCAICFEFMFDK